MRLELAVSVKVQFEVLKGQEQQPPDPSDEHSQHKIDETSRV